MFDEDYPSGNAILDGYELACTCGACPEQYDVYKDGQQVGYLRLRHGWFSARVPNYAGDIVYEANPKGDGIFESDEREYYLRKAIRAIAKATGNELISDETPTVSSLASAIEYAFKHYGDEYIDDGGLGRLIIDGTFEVERLARLILEKLNEED